jgi:tetratricopeptide (TPR) repeat protein
MSGGPEGPGDGTGGTPLPAAYQPGVTSRNDLGGTVFGSAVQAHDVHGGIHFHASQAPSVPSPSQLPAVPRLTGRATELAMLQAMQARSGPDGDHRIVVVISGLAGVGKTALALHWLHDISAQFPDGQLYADLRGHSREGPLSPSEVVGRFLRALGILPAQVPADLAERVGLYRSVTSGRRLIVLLDNAISAAQARPLQPAATSVTVVTSRWRLPGLIATGAASVHLEPLGVDGALELLTRTVGDQRVRDDPGAARELVRLCARLPLAVCVAGAKLASRPRWSVATLVQALDQEQHRLATLSLEDDMAVKSALDLSYEGLPPPAARLYRLLGLHPGPHFGIVIVAAAGDLPPDEAARLLEILVDASLLEEIDVDRYRFHDLVRLHASARASSDEPGPERAAALRRILDCHLYLATRAEEVLEPNHRTLARDYQSAPPVELTFGTGDEALAYLESERLNLLACVDAAAETGLHATTWQLVDALWPLFLRQKYHEDWQHTHSVGLAAARACGDLEAETRMLTSGGLGDLEVGRHQDALERFSLALNVCARTGDRRMAARTLNFVGRALQQAGRPDEAAERFQRSLEECVSIGDRRGVALALHNLAELAIGAGLYDDAIRYLGRAQAGFEEVGDGYNAAKAGVVLARVHLLANRPEPAARHGRDALDRLGSVGSSSVRAQALDVLGQIAERDGDVAAARFRYQEALDDYARVGNPAAQRVRERLSNLDPATEVEVREPGTSGPE